MFFGNRTRDARAAAAADADTGDAGWGTSSGATTPPPRGRRSAVADLGPALAAFHAAGAARAGHTGTGAAGAAARVDAGAGEAGPEPTMRRRRSRHSQRRNAVSLGVVEGARPVEVLAELVRRESERSATSSAGGSRPTSDCLDFFAESG